MPLRVCVLWALVAALAVYAWHEAIPSKAMGIQGLNPWNILLLSVVLSWAVSRSRERLVGDMPRPVTVLLALYLRGAGRIRAHDGGPEVSG